MSFLCQLELISSTLYARVFRTNVVSADFSSYVYKEKAAETKKLLKQRSYQKLVRKNVDEIDTRVEIHKTS